MTLQRDVIRVEPLSTFLAQRGAPVSPVVRVGEMVYVSGLPPFDPQTGAVGGLSIERQAEVVLTQMRMCLEAAGSCLGDVAKCNIYCTSAAHFAAINAIYAGFFPIDPPARIFICVPEWPGPFDIEVDCVAVARRPIGGAPR